jgi:sugar O-acyltransferase (sialic acid O-acetyltransferase NeuD family)
VSGRAGDHGSLIRARRSFKMQRERKLIIVGDGVFAQVAYEFFAHDSNYRVVAFSVERDYLQRSTLFGLPVVSFEDLAGHYAPADHSFFAALVFTQRNRLRTRLYLAAKAKGYAPASYVGSRADVHPHAEIGEHCFVCEGTVVQPRARVMSNVVLWSGNYVGHHALIKSNCFTLPHAVVSAFAQVGENCVIGPNASVLEGVKIADDCAIEAGAVVAEDMEARRA